MNVVRMNTISKESWDFKSVVKMVDDRMSKRTKELFNASQCGEWLVYEDGLTRVRMKRPDRSVLA